LFVLKKPLATIRNLFNANDLSCIVIFITIAFSTGFAAEFNFIKFASLAQQRYGDSAYQNVVILNQLLLESKSKSDLEKLNFINNFFNQKMAFLSDSDLWGASDYWATPLESLGKEAGDCEDFSIAKFFFLRLAGVSNDKLRLTYVRAEIYRGDIKASQAHMVLSYYSVPQSEPLILDNLTPDILPASKRPDLFPIFSFNSSGLWVGNSKKPQGNPTTNLSRWRDLIKRAQSDGIQ